MSEKDALASILEQLGKLRDPMGFFNAGLPNFDHLFGRDAAVTALQMLNREPEAARATLAVLSKFRGRKKRLRREEWPGKILHEHYPYGLKDMIEGLIMNDYKLRLLASLILWRFPYYGSIDSGAWYLILLHHYYRSTEDKAFVRELRPTVEGILSWYRRHAVHKPRELVTFRSHFVFGLKNQSWKDTIGNNIQPPVAMVEVQGYYYYALNLTAELYEEVLNDRARAEEVRAWADELRASFQKHFAPIDGVFPTAIDGRGQIFTNITSNPGQLLFTGILDRPQCDMVVKRLLAEDMLTPYGIRTEATSQPSFSPSSYQNGSIWPFDNWVIHQGLAKNGYVRQAGELKKGMLAVFRQWGNLPELYAVELDGELHGIDKACYIQAWSAGALINLLDDAPVI